MFELEFLFLHIPSDMSLHRKKSVFKQENKYFPEGQLNAENMVKNITSEAHFVWSIVHREQAYIIWFYFYPRI